MKVYHGGIQEIRTPLAKVGRCKYTQEIVLGQLAQHRPNNQFCLISQAAIDECLSFLEVEVLHLR